jgi:hypothetical protein
MSYIGNARNVLIESLILEPCNWSAWLDLAVLLPDREILDQLDLPKCMIIMNMTRRIYKF